jgi:hypothetical protein
VRCGSRDKKRQRRGRGGTATATLPNLIEHGSCQVKLRRFCSPFATRARASPCIREMSAREDETHPQAIHRFLLAGG